MHITKSTAQSGALAVPEILTLVLQELDMYTLLISAQRVCHLWGSLIRETPSLQQNLFLEPTGEKDNKLQRMFNPLLSMKFPTFLPKNDRPTNQLRECVDLTIIELITCPEKRPAYLRPEASWRRMLTQQPPAFTVVSTSSFLGVGLDKTEGPRQDRGLRMGTLFEWVLSRPGYFFASGVAIFFGGPSPVNTPFFNSGGTVAEWYKEVVANHDIIISADLPTEMGGEESEDAKTRDLIHSSYLVAGLSMCSLPLRELGFE